MSSQAAVERLTACLSRLPGVGRRSAERMAVRLLLDREGLLDELAGALRAAREEACCCSRCGSITSREEDPCRLCTSPARDGRLLCVVEDPGDIRTLEKSGGFRGRYHALMGKLSPMRGEALSDLRIQALLTRVGGENFEEVVLALSTDVEGDATAGFLAELLRGRGVRVTRLAFGLPARSGIAYSDSITLTRAMEGRTAV
jgi:recombination protein RecR